MALRMGSLFLSQIKQKSNTARVMCPKDAGGITNTVGPDQTTLLGSALFIQTGLSDIMNLRLSGLAVSCHMGFIGLKNIIFQIWNYVNYDRLRISS